MKCSFCGHYVERHDGVQARDCLIKALESELNHHCMVCDGN